MSFEVIPSKSFYSIKGWVRELPVHKISLAKVWSRVSLPWASFPSPFHASFALVPDSSEPVPLLYLFSRLSDAGEPSWWCFSFSTLSYPTRNRQTWPRFACPIALAPAASPKPSMRYASSQPTRFHKHSSSSPTTNITNFTLNIHLSPQNLYC